MAGRWDFNLVSPVEEILKKPSFTLTQLLDEDDVVSDTRNQKEALIKYFASVDILGQMISFLVDEAPAGANEKVKFRYPVVVTECLSADVEKLQSVVISTPALFSRLLNFFKQKSINLLVANQVCKLLSSLLVHQTAKMTAALKADAAWIGDTLAHIESAAVHEFWGKLWAQDAGFTAWLQDKGALDTLLAQFRLDNAVKHSDLAQMFFDVVSAATWDNALVQALVSEKGASKLVALLDPANPSALRYVPRAIAAVIKLMQTTAVTGSDAAKKALDPKQPLDKLPALLRLFIAKLPSLMAYLKTSATKKMKMQDHVTVDTVGPQRVALFELLEEVVRLNYAAVNEALAADSAFFAVLQDLVFKFNTNNFVHKHVDHIYTLHLEHQADKVAFLKMTGVIPRIIAAHEQELKDEEGGKKKPRVQYIPYLYEIAKAARAAAETDTALAAYLDGLTGWKDFSGWLGEYLEKQKRAAVPLQTEDVENFKPDFGEEGATLESNDAYLDGRDRDEDDLSLPDDVDLDSANDADDYDIEQAEILLTKQEVESFA